MVKFLIRIKLLITCVMKFLTLSPLSHFFTSMVEFLTGINLNLANFTTINNSFENRSCQMLRKPLPAMSTEKLDLFWKKGIN